MYMKMLESAGILTVLTFFLAYGASLYRLAGIESSLVLAVLGAASAALFFMVIPILLIRKGLHAHERDYGFKIPNVRAHAFSIGGVLVAHLLAAFVLSTTAAYQQFYMLPESGYVFVTVFVLCAALYFIAEEFLFRGFLLFSLWKRYRYIGAALSVAIFAVLHFAKAPGEMFIALVSGSSLVWLSLRTTSYIPAAVIHATFALALLALVNLS